MVSARLVGSFLPVFRVSWAAILQLPHGGSLMKSLTKWKKVQVILILGAATAMAAHAQGFDNPASFDGNNGAFPVHTSMVQGVDGNYYGTTSEGGAGCDSWCGTVFRLTPAGVLSTLHVFEGPDGVYPLAGLTLANDGSFYGTTLGGGTAGFGTVFKITPAGAQSVFYSFCVDPPSCTDGAAPSSPVIRGVDGNFYGTTDHGGAYGVGAVYRLTPEGGETVLHDFCAEGGACADGAIPFGGLVLASDGNFYGTTNTNGANNAGTVFEITPKGTFTALYSFCSQPNCTDGSSPDSALVEGRDGWLYGTTSLAGTTNVNCPDGCGTIFRVAQSGKFETVYSFTGPDGGGPDDAEMLSGSNGSLYGTTSGGGAYGAGTVFELSREGRLTTLYSFCARYECPDGEEPSGGLLQATTGIFYGTTYRGGADNEGTIFSLGPGLGPFVALVQAFGRVGHTGGILGQGLTGTTGVSFNGTPATFTIVSDTLLKATVPQGATTGYVTVTTPSGTLTSNVPFHVLK
jgi:uncharacterized repeat protein (TIGR03803 family)